MTAIVAHGELFAEGLEFPEGPVVGPNGTLYVTEIAAGRISKIDADGSVRMFARPGGGPNGMARGMDGAFYVANNGGIGWKDGVADPSVKTEHSRIERVDADGTVTWLYTHCGSQKIVSASDIAVDRAGALWFTDPGHGDIKAPQGRVYRAAPDGSLIEEVDFGGRWPNGLAFTPDGSQLVVAETGARALFSYDVVDGTSLAGRREFAKLPKGYYPDGICFDIDGNVLVAGAFGGAVVVFDPAGKLIQTIKLADPLTTNVAFAGNDYDELVITQARTGSVFRMTWPRAGSRLPFEESAR
jgi:gluconolactonase